MLATGPFVAALDGKRIWYLPPARTQERRTHVLSQTEQDTQLSSSRHFICKPYQTLPHLTLPYLTLLYLITLPYNNLITKPYKPYKTLPSIGILNSFLNSYLFVVCCIWGKTLFIIVVVVYKFCCTKSRSSPFFKSCHQFPYYCWSTVYSFTKRSNKSGFSGLIKILIDLTYASHETKRPASHFSYLFQVAADYRQRFVEINSKFLSTFALIVFYQVSWSILIEVWWSSSSGFPF